VSAAVVTGAGGAIGRAVASRLMSAPLILLLMTFLFLLFGSIGTIKHHGYYIGERTANLRNIERREKASPRVAAGHPGVRLNLTLSERRMP
jgi:hypothetical protein